MVLKFYCEMDSIDDNVSGFWIYRIDVVNRVDLIVLVLLLCYECGVFV